MEIEDAHKHRERIISLLDAAKLPSSDLPLSLENLLMIREQDQVVGIIGLEIYHDDGLLRSLLVQPDFRRTGIGHQLVAAIENLATVKNLHAIYLLTETAERYFSSLNYQIVNRTEVPAVLQQSSQFRDVCPQSAIVMMKKLKQG